MINMVQFLSTFDILIHIIIECRKFFIFIALIILWILNNKLHWIKNFRKVKSI